MQRTADEVEAKRQDKGLTIEQAALEIGVSRPTYSAIRNNPNHRLSTSACVKVAAWLDVSIRELSDWEGYRTNFLPIAELLDSERLKLGLSYSTFANRIGMDRRSLRQLRDGKRQIAFATCAKITQALGVDAEQVLQKAGYWDKISPFGKVLAVGMMREGLGEEALAARATVCTETVSKALWKSRIPRRYIYHRMAKALGIDSEAIEAAISEITGRPRQRTKPIRKNRSTKIQGQRGIIRRITRRGGREALRQYHRKQYRKHLADWWEKATVSDRKVAQERATAAIRMRWTTITEQKLERWILLHLKPIPGGQFSICRVCGKLTYTSNAALNKGQRGQYHLACLKQHRANDPTFAAWSREIHETRRRQIPGDARYAPRRPQACVVGVDVPHITPPRDASYPRADRTSSEELADDYEAAILYLRLRLRGATVDPRSGRTIASVSELAETRSIDRTTLYARMARLSELLPDLHVCSIRFAKTVTALQALRRVRTNQ